MSVAGGADVHDDIRKARREVLKCSTLEIRASERDGEGGENEGGKSKTSKGKEINLSFINQTLSRKSDFRGKKSKAGIED